MVIVDTSVWIDFLNGADTPQVRWLDQRLADERFGIVDLILCEVLQGLSSDEAAADVSAELRAFEVFETGGVELATRAAISESGNLESGIWEHAENAEGLQAAPATVTPRSQIRDSQIPDSMSPPSRCRPTS